MLQRSFTGLVGVLAIAVAMLALPSAASADACSPGTVDKTWDGSSSTDWFDPTNWTPQTANPPSQAQDVCVPTGTPNAPVIGPAPPPFTEATARTISSAELIDVQSGGILHLFNGTEESIFQDGITLGDSTTLNAAGPVTVHGDLAWNGNNSTIKGGTGATRRITIASDGTLTQAAGPGVQRILDTGTLRIEGSATFEGNTDGNFHQTGLANGADIEVGGASGPRTLDLQDDQLIFDFDGSADSVLRVLAGGTLTRTSTGGSAIADVQIPVENDGTVTAAAGTTTWLSSGSSGNSGQWAPAAGGFVNFAGGTHSIGGSTIAGAGTVYGSYEVASGQTVTVNGNYRWDNATTIGGAGTTLIAPSGTLTAPAGPGVQRVLDSGTLRIEGSATFEGNTDGNFHQVLLSTGADIEVGGASGPRTLDLQDDQVIFDGDGSDDSSLHVLAGGTLTRTSAGGSAIADVQIAVENDGTVSSGAGILGLSGGSGGQTSAGQYSPATGAVVGFGGGTHLLAAGAAINGPGTTTITSGTVSASGATTVAANAVVSLAGGTLASGAGGTTVHGTLFWDNGGTIGDGTTLIAPSGTLTAPAGPSVQRVLDAGTLRIEGSATFEGNTDGNFHQTMLLNGADVEVGGASGPRTLDLQDDHLIFDGDGGADSALRVLAGGTLTRTSAAGSASADVQIPVENDGTVTAAAGTTTWLSGGSSGNSGQWSPAAGAFVNFAGGTHSIGGSTIASAGTVYGSYQVGSAQTLTVNGNYRWDNNTTIGGAGTTLIAPSGTLTAPPGPGVQRVLDSGTLRIEGSATFEGNTDGNFHQVLLSTGADIEVGGASGPRTLDLQDDQLIFDGDGGADSALRVLAGGTLTRTQAGGGGVADVAIVLTVNGTLNVAAGTLASTTGFTSYNQTSDLLSGGTYAVRNGATFRFNGADVKTNGAEIVLEDAGSGFQDEAAQDGLRNLAANNATGKLRLRDGRSFTRTGAFTNSGLIDLAPTTKFTATGNYTQNASGTLATDIAGTVAGTSYGQLVAGNTAAVAGTLDADVSAYPPQTGDFFDVVSAGTARTGTFATVVGNGFTVNYLPKAVRLTPPTLSVANRTVTEGNAGTTVARFRVDLSSPSPGTVTVNYATSNDSATAPADYTATSGTLTFIPGQTSKTFDVPVVGDLLDEANERFNVTLSSPQFADLAAASATGTITDDDPPPTISVNDVTRGEGGAAHRFDVTLSGPSGQQVKVDYATANGTATAPADYAAATGTLTFSPGQTTKSVTVQSAQDTLDEADETFTLGLSNPLRATIADGSGLGTITDNDPTPSILITDATKDEGGTAHSFNVLLSAPSGRQVRVDYATADGTAKAPGDYTAKTTTTLIFQPGQTAKTVTVQSVQDTLDENNETFRVNLANPLNATISDASALGTIHDDDPPPTITINDVRRVEGANPQRFTISLSTPSGKAVVVDYATANGTAVAPGDYGAKSGSLIISPGLTSRDVLVNTVQDLTDEPNETYTLELSNATAGTIGDPTGLGTIVDDD